MPSCMAGNLCLVFLDIFWVGESDSDFIFTIWHQGHSHSGVKVHFSGNGTFIQSDHFVGIFCICELNFALFRRFEAIQF